MMFPMLVPAGKGEAHDGLSTFDPEHSFQKLRLVRDEELKDVLRPFTPEEAQFIADCLALRRAYNSKDQLALGRPFQRLWPFLVGQELWPQPHTPAEEVARKAMAKAFSLPALSDRKWARFYFPQLVSKALRDVRIVVWWFEKEQRFIPAISCPDLKTAFLLRGFMGDIRVCPHCDKPFMPDKANIDYCSIAHREAHRVARWRAKNPSKHSGKKGKKKGTGHDL